MIDETYIDELLNVRGYSIGHTYTKEPRKGRFLRCTELHPNIMEYIKEKYDCQLYLHQSLAIEAALRGENVVLATGTASGKTLSFSLPVFNTLLNDPESRALFFYPTKALAGDQLKSICELADTFGLSGRVFRFDGDVCTEDRKKALREGRIFLCTPDVLHATMLKNNNSREYDILFKNLKFIVLDECHVYSGAFGSNMAFVMRRLIQVCKRKKSFPQFLAASATSRDPGKHLNMLTSHNFTVIDEAKNGSPAGERIFIIANSDVIEEASDVKGIIADLVSKGHRFIAFCHSRRLIEQYYNDLIQEYPNISDKVMPYRSGYEVEDRQNIEDALRDKRLLGVISTSALELGVDLPDLEYCLLIGIPPTAMSFWQRVGRVGRRFGTYGKVLIFPGDNPLDDYYRTHPNELYNRPIEELIIHLDNRQLILSHFACARMESGNFNKPDFDSEIFGKDFVELANNINDIDIVDDVLINNDPHSIVNIRGIGDPTYEIFTIGGERRLGTITLSQLLREAYPQAVYRHMGDAFRVEGVFSRDCIVKVKHENRTASTSPVGYIFVKERTGPGSTLFRKSVWAEMLELYHTTVTVLTNTAGYREKIGQNWIQKKYPAPLQRRVLSEGVCIKLLPGFGAVSRDGLNAFAHALSNVYSILKPCDSAEISTYCAYNRQDNSSLMYFFDTTSGGLGISAGIFDSIFDLLPFVEERLTTCDHCDRETFDRGCPSCIQVPRWYEDNDHLSKQSALSILHKLRDICTDSEPQISVSPSYMKRTVGGFTSISELCIEEAAGDVNEIYVQRVYKPGTIIKMRSGQKGTVEQNIEENNNLFYVLKMEDGRSIKVRDMGFELVEGKLVYLCLNCGDEQPCQNEICPVCGMKLF